MIEIEPIDKWVRGRAADRVLVETREPLLVWQGRFPPVYAFAPEEIAERVLRPAAAPPESAGFDFFGPQLPVSQWYDVVAGDTVVEHGAWTLAELPDRVVVTWEPGVLVWTEEDEIVAGHPRDPHQRVETLQSSRQVEVSIAGVVVASSSSPVFLYETSLPTRRYLPRADVRLDLLVATDNRSMCPYKGVAEHYWSFPGPPEVVNVAWSYSAPRPAVADIADRIAFYDELVDVRVDGVLRPRPETFFSRATQRPGSGET